MWVHEKYQKKQFKGSYSWLKGERVFELTYIKENGELGKRVTFESWQAAKSLGWKKVA